MKPVPVITAATAAARAAVMSYGIRPVPQAVQQRYHDAVAPLDAAIRAALDAVNGRASSFTITEPNVVREIAQEVEALLDRSGVTQADRVGTVVAYIPAGPSARAYNHAAKSTWIMLRRFGKHEWRLVDVETCEVHPRQAERRSITINPEAAEAVQRHAMRAFTVAAP